MPKTKLGQTLRPGSSREGFNRIVAVAMARNGIKNYTQLAVLLGMDASSLNKRISGHTAWRYEELCRLFRVLKIPGEEVARAMGVCA